MPIDKKRFVTMMSGGGAAVIPWYLADGSALSTVEAAWTPFMSATQAESYINKANPGTHDLPAGTVPPTWNPSYGWSFNATQKQVLKSDIVAAQGWSAYILFSDIANTNVVIFGGYVANATFAINPRQAAGQRVYSNGGSLAIAAGAVTNGSLAIGGNKGYYNAVADAGVMADWADAGRAIWIGGNNDGSAGPVSSITCKVQLLAFFNTTRTAEQILAIDTAAKALIAGKTFSQVIFDGDSLTRGFGAAAGSDYPAQAMPSIGATTWDRWNLGIGGQTMDTINTNAAANVDTKYSATYTKSVVVLWAGVNDLLAGTAAADVYADISAYVSGRQTAGYKVIVLTVTKASTLTAPQETARQALNVLILNNAAGADAVVDVAAHANLQNTGDATYFFDGVHLTAAGYAIPAGMVAPQVLAV